MFNNLLYIKQIHSVVQQAITILINSVIEAYFHTDVYKLYEKNNIIIIIISNVIYLNANDRYCVGIFIKSNLKAIEKNVATNIIATSNTIKIIILESFFLNILLICFIFAPFL